MYFRTYRYVGLTYRIWRFYSYYYQTLMIRADYFAICKVHFTAKIIVVMIFYFIVTIQIAIMIPYNCAAPPIIL